ncbi:MAG: TraR/DksA C4-type zinc finger protein, partial [Burkholderiales bacterium]|nr:TraR/DksA C4-type zinc finger protein [Burkholderiales bacterium]
DHHAFDDRRARPPDCPSAPYPLTPSRLRPRWNHEPGSRLIPRWKRLALGWIEDGSYRVCSVCGLDIAAARLRAGPAAERCIVCWSAFEKQCADAGATASMRKVWRWTPRSTHHRTSSQPCARLVT